MRNFQGIKGCVRDCVINESDIILRDYFSLEILLELINL